MRRKQIARFSIHAVAGRAAQSRYGDRSVLVHAGFATLGITAFSLIVRSVSTQKNLVVRALRLPMFAAIHVSQRPPLGSLRRACVQLGLRACAAHADRGHLPGIRAILSLGRQDRAELVATRCSGRPRSIWHRRRRLHRVTTACEHCGWPAQLMGYIRTRP